jgi:hypothetical protein
MLKIVFELVKIRQALDEIQMPAENRAAQLQRQRKINSPKARPQSQDEEWDIPFRVVVRLPE